MTALTISGTVEVTGAGGGGGGTASGDTSVWAVPGGDTDVTAAYQASVLAAAEAGVKLKMPAGKYTITPGAGGGIYFPAGLHVEGYGAHLVCKPGSYSNVEMIGLNNLNDITIEGVVLDWDSQEGPGCFIVKASNTPNLTFRRCVFKNAVWAAVQTTDCEAPQFIDCDASNCSGGVLNIIVAGYDIDEVLEVRGGRWDCPADCYEAFNIADLSGGLKKCGRYKITDVTVLGSLSPTVNSCGIQVWANSENYRMGPGVIDAFYVRGFVIGISVAHGSNCAVGAGVVEESTGIGYEMGGYTNTCTGSIMLGNHVTQYGFTSDGGSGNAFTGAIASNCVQFNFSATNGSSRDVSFTGCKAINDAVDGSFSALALFGIDKATVAAFTVDFPNATAALGVYAVDVGGLLLTGSSFNQPAGPNGYIYINNAGPTVRDNIKIKNNLYLGGVAGPAIQLHGTSYGPNVDTDGIATVGP